MSAIIEWLSSYNAEYDVINKVLYIKKPIGVKEFITLKEILEPYRYKVYDIIIEG